MTNGVSQELRVWLDDDLEDRAAPEGWVHVTKASEAEEHLLTGAVVELSLDHDLGPREEHGCGMDVINFIAEQQVLHGRILWPRDGLTIHSANPSGSRAMLQVAENYAQKAGLIVRRTWTAGGKPKLTFTPTKPAT